MILDVRELAAVGERAAADPDVLTRVRPLELVGASKISIAALSAGERIN